MASIARFALFLFLASPVVAQHPHPHAGDLSVINVDIENVSGVTFQLRNQSGYTFHDSADLVTVPPHATTRIQVRLGERVSSLEIPFDVLNVVTAPNTHPAFTLGVEVE